MCDGKRLMEDSVCNTLLFWFPPLFTLFKTFASCSNLLGYSPSVALEPIILCIFCIGLAD
jgi:hypothetical protein